MDIKIGFRKYKPLDLKHQLNYGLELKGIYFNSNKKTDQLINNMISSAITTKFDEKRLGLNYFLQYSLYPNSRTVVNFNVQGDNGIRNGLNGTHFYHSNSATISGNYFISYHTGLFFDLGVQNQSNDFNNFFQLQSTNLFFNVGLMIGL
jgi:hypothetical protein